MAKLKQKSVKELTEKRNDLLARIVHKLKSPYTEVEERLEILDWFKRLYTDEIFKSTKDFEQWGKDLKRLANGEE